MIRHILKELFRVVDRVMVLDFGQKMRRVPLKR